jgi:hypothetical protein
MRRNLPNRPAMLSEVLSEVLSSIPAARLRWVRRYGPRAFLVVAVMAVVGSGRIRVVLSALAWVLLLVVLGAVGLLWWRLGPRRWWVFGGARRTAHLRTVFAQAQQRARAPGIELVQVVRVNELAKTGTKAVVRHPDGGVQDAWFWNVQVSRGDVLLVRASTGYGPVNNLDHVLYIGTEKTGQGILNRIPPAAWRAGVRHPGTMITPFRDVDPDDGPGPPPRLEPPAER